MKKLVLATLTASALASSAAIAAPVAVPANTPLFFQFVNAEQFSVTNAIDGNGSAPGAPAEGNWGVFQITNVVRGTVLAPLGSDIQGGGAPVFVDQVLPLGAQILGIFYGTQNTSGTTGATGGRFDAYYWEPGHAIQNVGTELGSGLNLAKRTDAGEYTGFTCASGNTAQCTFLFSGTFESGSLPGAPGVGLASPVTPGSADGTSKSYLSVDPLKVGAWTNLLNTNFFTLDPCNRPVGYNYAAGGEVCPTTGGLTAAPGGISMPTAQDIRLDNNFTRGGATAWDIAGTNIIGLRSNDPGRTFSVPEPGTVALLGVALAVAGGLARRRG